MFTAVKEMNTAGRKGQITGERKERIQKTLGTREREKEGRGKGEEMR